MLNNSIAAAMHQICNHLDGTAPLRPEQVAAALTVFRNALATDSVTRARASARKSTGHGKPGRPPQNRYVVALGSQATAHVQGARAALALVAEWLAANAPGQRAPSMGSLQVTLSRNGHWWRMVETATGAHAITITRAQGDLEPRTVESAP